MTPAPAKKLSAPAGDVHALEVHLPAVESKSKKTKLIESSHGEKNENLSAEIANIDITTISQEANNSIEAGIEMTDAMLPAVREEEDHRQARQDREVMKEQHEIERAITSAAVVAAVHLLTLDASITGQKKPKSRMKRLKSRLSNQHL